MLLIYKVAHWFINPWEDRDYQGKVSKNAMQRNAITHSGLEHIFFGHCITKNGMMHKPTQYIIN